MSAPYTINRTWSDQFIPEIRRIIGPMILQPSTLEVDTQQAADLMVFTAKDVRIAARMRKHNIFERWPHDFTLRSKCRSGQPTELDKIAKRWGDWLFYGFAEQETFGRDRNRPLAVISWKIFDLHVFRQTFVNAALGKHGTPAINQKDNGDGTGFVSFDWREFPKNFVIASSDSDSLRWTA